MVRTHLCLLALATLCFNLAQAVVPSYIKVCGRRDPKINECVKNSIEQLVPKLRVGIPELEVPSLEPLEIDKIALADLPEFKTVATNIKLSGLSNFVITNVDINLDQARMEVDAIFPEVFMKSDYDVEAKILVPIHEKGPIDLKTNNVESKIVMNFKTVDRRGRKLIYFSSMSCKLEVKNYKATFMPGSKNPLHEAINSMLETSGKEIIDSMTPNIEKAVSKRLLESSNKILKHFTFDELFPDRE